MSKHCSDSHNNHLHKSSRSSSQGHGWSSRNDVIYFSSLTVDHSLSFFFPCISSFICILGPSFPSGHDSIKIAGGWSSGGHAGGYAVETRLYDSDQIGLRGGRKQALSLWKPPQCLVMSSWLWSLLSMDKNTTQTGLCGSLQTCQRLRLNGLRSPAYLTPKMRKDSLPLHVYFIWTHNQCFGHQLIN